MHNSTRNPSLKHDQANGNDLDRQQRHLPSAGKVMLLLGPLGSASLDGRSMNKPLLQTASECQITEFGGTAVSISATKPICVLAAEKREPRLIVGPWRTA